MPAWRVCQTLPCQVWPSGGVKSGLLSVFFVAPHASDDAVGEMAFVGSSGFASGLAFAGFSGEIGGGVGLEPPEPEPEPSPLSSLRQPDETPARSAARWFFAQ